MNLSWYLYYGRQLGMSRQEILVTPYGEMTDMLACSSVYNGTAEVKRKLTFEEMLRCE